MPSAEILARIKELGRQCGDCSLCCKVLYVIELDKHSGTYCDKCRPGAGGCSIYETRPQICRGYYCGWMMSKDVGPEWYPLKSHMVLSLGKLGGIQTVSVACDDDYPLSWLEPPYYQQLKQMAERGLRVNGVENIHLVQVRSQGRVWLLLPNKDVEITSGSYVLKLIAQGEWDVEMFDTDGQADARVRELSMAS